MQAGATVRLRPTVRVGLILLALLGLAGCEGLDTLGGNGVTFQPTAGWQAVAPTTWLVPGQALGAWKGPGGANMVVYRTIGAPGATAKEVLTSVATRYENFPETKVVARSVVSVGGQEAARVEMVAAGNGENLAPTGMGTPYAPPGVQLVPTRRVLISVPRASDTICLVWHAPEAQSADLLTQIDSLLKGVTIAGGSREAQAY